MSICHLCGGGGLCPLCDGSGKDDLWQPWSFYELLWFLENRSDLSEKAIVDQVEGLTTTKWRKLRMGEWAGTEEVITRIGRVFGLDDHELELFLIAAGFSRYITQLRARDYLMIGWKTRTSSGESDGQD